MSEGFVDASVSSFVRIRKGRSVNGARKSAVIQVLGSRIQTQDNAAQAFSKGQLFKTQTQELLPARKGFNPAIPMVLIHALLKGISGQR